MSARALAILSLLGCGVFAPGCGSSEKSPSCVVNQPCTCAGNLPGATTCVNDHASCSCAGAVGGSAAHAGATAGAGMSAPNQIGALAGASGSLASIAGSRALPAGGAGSGGSRGASGSGGIGTAIAGATAVAGSSTAGAGGMSGASAAGMSAAGMTGSTGSGDMPGSLPKPKEMCPKIATGNVTFLGSTVSITASPAGKKGPMVFYWHGTAETAAEVNQGLGQGAIADVQANGGVIASFTDTNSKGTNTGDAVWYTGDFDTADEILGCAIEQGLVDVTHIHSAGYSAGGLQTGAMIFAKAYLASVLCYSGGQSFVITGQLPDPTNVPAMIGAHGPPGTDVFAGIFDGGQSTLDLEKTMKGLKGFVIDCQDSGDHIVGFIGGERTAVAPAAWQFFKDHPFKNSKPYAAGLPAASKFPAACKISQ